jgi:hypothetical protein
MSGVRRRINHRDRLAGRVNSESVGQAGPK